MDYRNLDAKDNGPLLEYTDYEHGLVNVLCNLVYYEEEFVDESTGNTALRTVWAISLFRHCLIHASPIQEYRS